MKISNCNEIVKQLLSDHMYPDFLDYCRLRVKFWFLNLREKEWLAKQKLISAIVISDLVSPTRLELLHESEILSEERLFLQIQ